MVKRSIPIVAFFCFQFVIEKMQGEGSNRAREVIILKICPPQKYQSSLATAGVEALLWDILYTSVSPIILVKTKLGIQVYLF
jgi:hypothetical protein